jgi:hypothetical protein
MKALTELTPLWVTNKAPVKNGENDYLLKFTADNHNGVEVIIYAAIQWCATQQSYYIEPVDIQKGGKLTPTEAKFSTHGLLALRVQLRQLGITVLKRFIDVEKPQTDINKQLHSIHPALVPQSK